MLAFQLSFQLKAAPLVTLTTNCWALPKFLLLRSWANKIVVVLNIKFVSILFCSNRWLKQGDWAPPQTHEPDSPEVEPGHQYFNRSSCNWEVELSLPQTSPMGCFICDSQTKGLRSWTIKWVWAAETHVVKDQTASERQSLGRKRVWEILCAKPWTRHSEESQKKQSHRLFKLDKSLENIFQIGSQRPREGKLTS